MLVVPIEFIAGNQFTAGATKTEIICGGIHPLRFWNSQVDEPLPTPDTGLTSRHIAAK